MNHRSGTWGRPLRLYLALLAAFALGILADRSGWMPGSGRRPPPGLGHTFDPFWETWNLVDARYVDRAAVDPKRMTEGAIEGMLDSLGDVGHTAYLTPDELHELETSLNGQFEGIGARMTVRNGHPTVVDTIPGAPARAAGLRPGDVLLEVDGKSVASLPLDRVVQMVRGRPGTVVRLKVTREGEPHPLDLEIQRAAVDLPDVTWHLLPGVPVAHVALRSFGKQADEQLRSALEKARALGARGLILDVRGNPGGEKDQAVAVSSEFLKEGNVFLEQDSRGRRTPVPVRPGGVATDVPLVLLIDEGTASSAEIFAGALQDHHRAKLVGTKTFGTGTVLEPFELSNGGAVLLAVAEWLTPDGRQIWHQGITPDVAVALPEGVTPLLPETEDKLDAEGLAHTQDKQLSKALELLKEQLR